MSVDSESAGLEQLGYKPELRRTLGFWPLVLFGCAMLVPIAPVAVYGAIQVPSQGHMALCYLVAMIPMSFTAWSYGQMASAFPVAGSSFSFVSRAMNAHLGTLTGWVIFLDYVLFPVINYIILALYVQNIFPTLPYWPILIIAIVVVTFINITGVKNLTTVNNIFTVFGFAVVIYFIVAAIHALSHGAGTGFSTVALYNPKLFSGSALWAGASIACFSFIGFDAMTTLTEEVHNPKRNLVRAELFVCFLMGIIFALTAFFGQAVFPDFTKFTNPNIGFANVALAAGGHLLNVFVSLAMITGAFCFAVDAQAGVVRLMYGMGRDGIIPRKFFAHLHPKTKVPIYSNILIAVICVVLGWLNLNTVIPFINFGALAAYAMVNASVIVHYYGKGKQRGAGGTFKYLVIPGLGVVTCVTLWLGLSGQAHLVGCIWLLIGVVYLAIKTSGFRKSPVSLDM